MQLAHTALEWYGISSDKRHALLHTKKESLMREVQEFHAAQQPSQRIATKDRKWAVRIRVYRFLVFSAVMFSLTSLTQAEEARSLVERLGFPKDTRVVILNADDFGMNHGGTAATIQALRAGILTSATVMVPCPWFPMVVQFAKENPWANIGVHTVLTSEWVPYKWGPVLGCGTVPSLCTEEGYFYSDVVGVYMNAKLDEAEREVRAQIDKALKAGIDVTHIDAHMGTMQFARTYHERYIRIAKDYNLPCRIAGPDIMAKFNGLDMIALADSLGVLHPDVLVMDDPEVLENLEEWWKNRLAQVEPGKVTEIYIHCGDESEEMKTTTNSWKRRLLDTQFFSKPETLAYLESLNIVRISYRDLRELQRTGQAPRRSGR
jgi:hypothetical protein